MRFPHVEFTAVRPVYVAVNRIAVDLDRGVAYYPVPETVLITMRSFELEVEILAIADAQSVIGEVVLHMAFRIYPVPAIHAVKEPGSYCRRILFAGHIAAIIEVCNLVNTRCALVHEPAGEPDDRPNGFVLRDLPRQISGRERAIYRGVGKALRPVFLGVPSRIVDAEVGIAQFQADTIVFVVIQRIVVLADNSPQVHVCGGLHNTLRSRIAADNMQAIAIQVHIYVQRSPIGPGKRESRVNRSQFKRFTIIALRIVFGHCELFQVTYSGMRMLGTYI